MSNINQNSLKTPFNFFAQNPSQSQVDSLIFAEQISKKFFYTVVVLRIFSKFTSKKSSPSLVSMRRQ